MSQQELPQFDKLWKILDDCIQNNRFKQNRYVFSNGEDERCVLGAIASYVVNDENHIKCKIIHCEHCTNIIRNMYNLVDYRGKEEEMKKDKQIFDNEDKSTFLKYLKNKYNTISTSGLVYLNVKGYSFEQIRDMLKEVDI